MERAGRNNRAPVWREPEAHLLGELTKTPGAVQIEPQPLPEEAVIESVASALGGPLHPAFARECFSLTGGNPLLARGLAEHGAVGSEGDLELLRRIGPEPVAWAVQTTLRRLPDPASALARAVAVFDTHGTVELTAALAGVDVAAAQDAISELQVAGLVEGETELSFAHPLIGQAIRASIPPAERASLHGKAAELLAERGDEAAVAAHLLLSPGAGRPWAAETLVRAAGQARRGASPGRSVELLERALAEPPAPEQRPRVLADLARAQAAIRDPASVDTFSAAVAEAEVGEDRARLLLDLSRAHQDQARFAEAAEAAALGLRIDFADERLRTASRARLRPVRAGGRQLDGDAACRTRPGRAVRRAGAGAPRPWRSFTPPAADRAAPGSRVRSRSLSARPPSQSWRPPE